MSGFHRTLVGGEFQGKIAFSGFSVKQLSFIGVIRAIFTLEECRGLEGEYTLLDKAEVLEMLHLHEEEL